MTFKAPDSLAEQIAHHLAERIIRGEMKPGERIQEQKVTLALNVSRGSVREALLILERRHLIAILPRRGAHVTELTPHKVQSLCTLMSELYILLGNSVANGWQVQSDMAPFVQIQQRLTASYERQDIRSFRRRQLQRDARRLSVRQQPVPARDRRESAAGHEPRVFPRPRTAQGLR
jgi:DNA-binding GntR family transcriptional regulator